jgi:DNA-binding CsgD family transcriptional regulator
MTCYSQCPRRDEVQKLLLKGLSNKQIAYDLGMSIGSVKTHMRDILLDCGATNRTMCVLMLLGVIPERRERTRHKRELILENYRQKFAKHKLKAAGFKAAA